MQIPIENLESEINNLKSTLSSLVQSKTFSTTINSTGNIQLDLTYPSQIPICVTGYANSTVLSCFVIFANPDNSSWHAKVYSNSTGNIETSISCSGTIYYINM